MITKTTHLATSAYHRSLPRQTYMGSIWIPLVVCHFYSERNPASGDRTSTVAAVFPNGGISRSLLLETNRSSACRMMDPILDIH
jgi:hypothetical protein